MMECLEAQETVSAALDGEAVDSGTLEQAKMHSRTCPECSAYVRALVEVRRAPLPEPPADLANRIVAAVQTQAASPVPVTVPDPRLDAIEAPSAGGGLEGVWTRLIQPRNRRALIGWSTVAATIFIAAGVGAVSGVRIIMAPRAANEIEVLESGFVESDSQMAAETPAGTAAEAAAPGAATEQEGAKTVGTGFIVVDGVVYRSAGVDGSVTRSSLSPQGSTQSALDTGRPAARRTVYGAGEPSRVFVETEDRSMLGFDRVTTTFQGRTYVLKSGAIPSFGEPVTLPSGIPEPSSSDGSPTFRPVDATTQPPVYLRSGRSATDGIALPPGARPDVGASWTWWTPAKE